MKRRMPYSKRRGSRDFNYAGLDGDGDDVPVGAEDVDPEDVCPQCSRPVSNWDPAIRCDSCETWNHAKCEGMSEIEYEVLIQSKGMGLLLGIMCFSFDLLTLLATLHDLT